MSVLAISAPSLTFTVPFALCTDVVAEHGAEDEVFLGRQLVKRTGDKQTDGIETFAATEVEVPRIRFWLLFTTSAVRFCTSIASQPNFWAIFSAIASHVPVEEP